jgi:hypothetical protein
MGLWFKLAPAIAALLLAISLVALSAQGALYS